MPNCHLQSTMLPSEVCEYPTEQDGRCDGLRHGLQATQSIIDGRGLSDRTRHCRREGQSESAVDVFANRHDDLCMFGRQVLRVRPCRRELLGRHRRTRCKSTFQCGDPPRAARTRGALAHINRRPGVQISHRDGRAGSGEEHVGSAVWRVGAPPGHGHHLGRSQHRVWLDLPGAPRHRGARRSGTRRRTGRVRSLWQRRSR
jgi:hypothetical protein